MYITVISQAHTCNNRGLKHVLPLNLFVLIYVNITQQAVRYTLSALFCLFCYRYFGHIFSKNGVNTLQFVQFCSEHKSCLKLIYPLNSCKGPKMDLAFTASRFFAHFLAIFCLIGSSRALLSKYRKVLLGMCNFF